MPRIKADSRLAVILLCIGGLSVSLYLVLEAFFSSIPLYCPAGGLFNCVAVTSSSYSRIFGIPVALMGFLWFALILAIAAARPASYGLILLPLWGIGMVFVGYLVYVELLILHAVCVYCTVAHVLGVLLGIPIMKLALESE